MPLFQQSVVSHSLPVPKGSEVIGWRLATQESVASFHFTKDTAFSPSVLRNSPSTGQFRLCLISLHYLELSLYNA